MSIELNTLSPKKWTSNFSGVSPTWDITDGVRIGDIAIDSSTSPNRIWICADNTNGAPIWTSSISGKANIISVSNTYNAAVYDMVILANTSSTAFTINLPAASGNDGVQYEIKKTDSSGNAVTIDGNGSETIDGSTTQVITSRYVSINIICDGNEWFIL